MPATRIQDFQINSLQINALKGEIAAARGDKASLAERLNSISAQLKTGVFESAFNNAQPAEVLNVASFIGAGAVLINAVVDVVNDSTLAVDFTVYSGQDALYEGTIDPGRAASFETARADVRVIVAGAGRVKCQASYISMGG
jgi:hypothetical protein